MKPELIKRVRLLVGEGKADEALTLFNDDVGDNDIIALKARLRQLRDKKIRGILSNEQEQVENNSIVNDLLEWTKKANENRKKKQATPEKIDAEFISFSRKILMDSLVKYYIISIIPISAAIILVIIFMIDKGGLLLGEGLGCIFISIVSGWPFREILLRKDKISFLEVLLLKINNLDGRDEIEKVNHMAWGIIESTLLKSQKNG